MKSKGQAFVCMVVKLGCVSHRMASTSGMVSWHNLKNENEYCYIMITLSSLAAVLIFCVYLYWIIRQLWFINWWCPTACSSICLSHFFVCLSCFCQLFGVKIICWVSDKSHTLIDILIKTVDGPFSVSLTFDLHCFQWNTSNMYFKLYTLLHHVTWPVYMSLTFDC